MSRLKELLKALAEDGAALTREQAAAVVKLCLDGDARQGQGVVQTLQFRLQHLLKCSSWKQTDRTSKERRKPKLAQWQPPGNR
jgi:sirohydrochlorin ferrochelatase